MVTIEPYREDLRSQVLNLWARALPLDALTEDVFEQRILLDENFDAETFLLALESGRPVGFLLGMYGKRRNLGDADPDGTRCWITGLGAESEETLAYAGPFLLKEIESRFRTMGKKEILVSTYPPGYVTPGVDRKANGNLLSLYQEHGYAEVKQALSMDAQIVLLQVPPAVAAKEKELRAQGIEVRPYRRTDLLAFLKFLEATMPTDWIRVERANLKKIGTGGFSTDQVTVVMHGAEVIGYCQFEGSHFGPFGVSDAYQGKGIGTVLLARTLERMRTHGYHDAWVMWTDDKAARVYRKFGFKETRRFSILKKML
jgi:GNAT superfamily N-acetyltransferase